MGFGVAVDLGMWAIRELLIFVVQDRVSGRHSGQAASHHLAVHQGQDRDAEDQAAPDVPASR